ncbi:3',5'-cyclic AMP phosphodiesterase CpdA [Thermosporothrix hazakensis]|jgi:3',5'-cyclic AMP phosphodiesterase CpdA|uniref:3',5'-cyclic AMP phosphodiesterase CpdA n=1 Tax=Thermosporothrix hazakensis TaxID=644383 RepID=A0A326U5L0_THEHA|nr:metallophosphoesterase [Thermosporothrix hazakensis]PZW29221.1 3',5'-cyclic AMP phosphodiesterase CpdA [Thermosporothrix hazakensis]GCE45427.1 hypothetical protein KTH_02960 [Thermosporothrix hazakensis]
MQGQAADSFTFFVISDVHIEPGNTRAISHFQTALQDLHEIAPQAGALVINGDMTSTGRPQSYAAFQEVLNSCPHPDATYLTIGNHEFFHGEGNEVAIQRFLAVTGERAVYYSRKIGGYPFLFLGSESWGPVGSPYKDSAVLTEKQLDWLKQELQRSVSPDTDHTGPIFLFLHQPLPNTVSGSHLWHPVRQDKELRALLAPYPQVILFSGHTHYSLQSPTMVVQQRWTMVNSATVYQLWGDDEVEGEIPLETDDSQGLVVEVSGSSVIIRAREFLRKQWLSHYVIELESGSLTIEQI